MLRGARRRRLLATASGGISAMLFAVRRALIIFVILAGGGLTNAAAASAWQEVGQTPAQIPAPPQTQSPPTPPQQLPPAQNLTPPAAPVHTGPVIVINAAHGGTDDGARSENGLVEKNVVLIFARMLRSEFERQGYRVVMTRNDDSNPSYEDRAAVANAYRDAIFISLHVSSTGQLGATRAYSYQFSSPVAAGSAATSADAAGPVVAPTPEFGEQRSDGVGRGAATLFGEQPQDGGCIAGGAGAEICGIAGRVVAICGARTAVGGGAGNCGGGFEHFDFRSEFAASDGSIADGDDRADRAGDATARLVAD